MEQWERDLSELLHKLKVEEEKDFATLTPIEQKREIDAIVKQVVILVQRSKLDSKIKDDIMLVKGILENNDNHFLILAGVLHFCRILLHISGIEEVN